MESTHSITQYIEDLKQGDPDAAQQIWERFLERLIRVADRKLKGSPRKAMNEEDVVQVAFAQFFKQVQDGRFSRLDDRGDLWQILVMLVDRRAKDQIRKQITIKAGGGKVGTETVFIVLDNSRVDQGIAKVPDASPTPEMAVEFTEQFKELMAGLQDDSYRQIAMLKMQGYKVAEIVEATGLPLRTVERRLKKIREEWSAALSDDRSIE